MTALLSLFMVYMIAVQAFALDVGLGPGLSLKNGILYLFFAFLLMRYAINRDFKIELGGILGSFALMIGYALLSTVVILMVVQYPGYTLIKAMTQLKGLPFDFLAFYFVYFFGLKTQRSAMTVLTTILLVVVATNVLSGIDGIGLYRLETINRGEDESRVQGIIGEHNQYGAFIAMFLPPLVAAVAASSGWRRLFWMGGTLVSFAVLVMTVSRGAFVGLALAGIFGLIVFRRYLLNAKVIGWMIGGAAVVVVVLAVLLLTTHYGAVLSERLLGQSASTDVWEISSGRTELWADAVRQMMRTPLSLVTGFGWATYFVLPSALPLAPHNTYLWYWFEIGLPGVLAFIAIFVQLISVAMRCVEKADPVLRGHFIGFAIGALALAISIFFVEIYNPWPYFWAFAGVVMRLAVLSRASQSATVVAPVAAVTVDRFGWNAASARQR